MVPLELRYIVHILNCCYCSVVSYTFATPWTIACQVPLSMGFPRQQFWSGLPFPSPGDLRNLGIKPASPAWAAAFFPTEPPGKSAPCKWFAPTC